MLAITGLGSRFWLHSGMGASLAHATTKPKPRSCFSLWKKSCHSHPLSAAMMMINHTSMNPPLYKKEDAVSDDLSLLRPDP